MSAGDGTKFDDAPGSLPRLRAALLKWPDIGAALRLPRRIDRRWEIPYLAGISKDGRIVFVDKHLPERLRGIPLDKYLEVHESVEYAIWRVAMAERRLMKFLDARPGLLYEACHHLATAAEQFALAGDGYDWDLYRSELEPYYSPIEREKVRRMPPVLATYPYKGEELASIEKAMERSRMAQDEANYLDAAPTRRRCELCEYFLPRLSACKLVSGDISPQGSCDFFMPKGA